MKLLLLIAFFTTSCAGLVPVDKADQAKVSKIDHRAKKIAFKNTKTLYSSKESLIPLKRGQWVATLSTNTKTGDKTLTIRKVVKVLKSKVTLETETYTSTNDDPATRLVIRQVIKNYPKSFAIGSDKNFQSLMANFEIISMKSKKDNEKVQELTMSAKSPFAKAGLNILSKKIKFEKATKKPCKTSYIRSKSCYYLPYSMGIMGFKIEGINIQNSRVPILGYIEAKGTDFSEVVIAYGFKSKKLYIK